MIFADKKIIITGASSGLGRALSIALSEKGAVLFLLGRNTDALEETKSLCKYPEKTTCFRVDITDKKQVHDFFQTVAQTWGGIDHLVLNAGKTMWAAFENLQDTTAIEDMMQTNFMGNVACIYQGLPMLKKNRGMIVAISSLQGKLGVPYHTGYAASKHALGGFLDSLRLELSEQVSIISIYPSWLKGTHLRANGIVDRQKTSVSNEHEKGTDVTVCSQLILRAMAKKKRNTFIPWKYQFLPMLAWLFPTVMDRIIVQKTKSNVSDVQQ